MNCVDCGAPLEGHEKFCGSCGTRVRRAAAQQPPHAQPQYRQPPPPQQRPQDAPAHPPQPARPAAPPAAAKPRPNVVVPAVFMMLSAMVGVLLTAIGLVAPEFYMDLAYEMDVPMEQVEASFNPVANLIFLLVNLVIVGGSFSMMRRGSKGLAITAAILSMINIGNCCCVLGLPFGLWSLIVATRPNAFGP